MEVYKLYAFFAVLMMWVVGGEKLSTIDDGPEVAIAFPGAEGYGKYATGGRGGKVWVVTNLNDDGPGSLREAVQDNKPRIVVFAVSGTIHLKSKLNIKGNITIAGQTAPGDGICLADQPVSIAGDNVIVRYLRIRMGDKYQNLGEVAGSGHDDALSASRRNHIIIDHCSLSWSTDEVLSVYAGDSTTIQWCMIYEPLNYSYHFEAGDTDFEHHGYGGIWGGRHLSAHHNLFAHCLSRTPRFDGIRNAPEEFVHFSNNVIYNWGHNNMYAGEGGRYNIIANYYKAGPNTNKKVQFQIANPGKVAARQIPFGYWFVQSNYVQGSMEVSANNALGVRFSDAQPGDAEKYLVKQPFDTEPVTTHKATQACDLVLRHAGAVLPVRDTLDARIVREVEKGKGRIIDVQGGFAHGTPFEQTINAWPVLNSIPAPSDTDADGMPDAWEDANGLNKHSANDAAGYTLDKRYTNIEVYINSLVKQR